MKMETLPETQHFEFLRKTDNKSRHHQIKFLVRLGMQGYHQFLDGKRQRLRVLLEEEAQQFEKEYENMIQVQINENTQNNERLLLVFMEQKNSEVKNFVNLKKIQQNYDNCDEIRTNVVQQIDRDIRRCQLAQIEEKRRMSCEEKFGESGWREIAKRFEAQAKRNEHIENCLKRGYIVQTVQCLDDQVKAKEKKMIEERLSNQLYIKRKIAEDEKLIELDKLKINKVNENRNEDLFNQMKQKADLQVEQNEFERKFNDSVKNQELMEMVDNNLTKRKLNEISKKNLNYAIHMKNVRKIRNEENSSMVDEMKARIDCCEIDKKQSNRGKLNVEARNIHKMFLEKIYANEELKKTAESRKRQEGFISKTLPMKFREPINKPEEFRRRRCELRRQIEHLNSIKAIEDEKSLLESKKCEEYNGRCLQLAEQHLLVKSELLPPHPHMRYLKCPKSPKNS